MRKASGIRLGIYIRSLQTARGAERIAVSVARGLARRRHAIDFLVEDRSGWLLDDLASEPGVRIVDLRATRGPAWRERSFQLAAALRLLAAPATWRAAGMRGISALSRLAIGDDPPIAALVHYLRAERPHAVLSLLNYPNFVLLLAARLARSGARIAVSVRNHESSYARHSQSRWRRSVPSLIRRCFPAADVVIAISKGVAEDVARIGGVPRERIRVIYNPVAPDIHELARKSTEHPWFDAGLPVLIAVGKLKPQKDFPTLLRAFQQVRAKRPARLIVLGEGDERGTLHALAKELGIAADVDFPGFVRNPFAYFRRASVFVLSSRWEGLGNVLIEALACGCPIVSTDCPAGPAEILADGEFGRLVPVGASDEMAQAILDVLDAPPPPERLIERSREFALDQALDAYESALMGR